MNKDHRGGLPIASRLIYGKALVDTPSNGDFEAQVPQGMRPKQGVERGCKSLGEGGTLQYFY